MSNMISRRSSSLASYDGDKGLVIDRETSFRPTPDMASLHLVELAGHRHAEISSSSPTRH